MGTVNKDFRVKNGLQVDQTASMGNTTISGFANVADSVRIGNSTVFSTANSSHFSGNANTANTAANSALLQGTNLATLTGYITSNAAAAYTNATAFASNADNIASGTIVSARIAGVYSGITGLGTIGTNTSFSANASFGNRLFTKGVIETSNSGTANTLDLSVTTDFVRTVSTARTIIVSNPAAAGNSQTFSLELINGGAAAVTWPASFKWPNATPPSLTVSGTDLIIGRSRDGGTTWLITYQLNFG